MRSGFLPHLLSGVCGQASAPHLDNGNAGGGGMGRALDLAKASQGSGSVCCWSNGSDFLFFFLNNHFWCRNKEQQQKITPQSEHFSTAWLPLFSATPCPNVRVLRQVKRLSPFYCFVLPIDLGKANLFFCLASLFLPILPHLG